MTAEEERQYVASLVNKISATTSRHPQWVLLPTYACNFNCGYCYQAPGQLHEHPRLARHMSASTLARVFRVIRELETIAGEDEQLRRAITLCGGEPLLLRNRALIDRVLRESSSDKETILSAISNGSELDGYADLIRAGSLAALQITLDGPPEVHDRRRPYSDGRPSFGRIAQNISMALEYGARVTLRVNADRENVDNLLGLADEIVQRGWPSYEGFSAYVAPVRRPRSSASSAKTFASWPLGRRLEGLRAGPGNMWVIDRADEDLRRRVRDIMVTGGDPDRRVVFCGAQLSMYVFDSLGDVYACWEQAGDRTWRIGEVTAGGELRLRADNAQMWRGRSVATTTRCSRCAYALYCGGGCGLKRLEPDMTWLEGHSGAGARLPADNGAACDGFPRRFRAVVAEAWQAHVAEGALRTRVRGVEE
jgi:uncharacterized protein